MNWGNCSSQNPDFIVGMLSPTNPLQLVSEVDSSDSLNENAAIVVVSFGG